MKIMWPRADSDSRGSSYCQILCLICWCISVNSYEGYMSAFKVYHQWRGQMLHITPVCSAASYYLVNGSPLHAKHLSATQDNVPQNNMGFLWHFDGYLLVYNCNELQWRSVITTLTFTGEASRVLVVFRDVSMCLLNTSEMKFALISLT